MAVEVLPSAASGLVVAVVAGALPSPTPGTFLHMLAVLIAHEAPRFFFTLVVTEQSVPYLGQMICMIYSYYSTLDDPYLTARAIRYLFDLAHVCRAGAV